MEALQYSAPCYKRDMCRVKTATRMFKGTGAFLLWGRARRAGAVQPEEEKTQMGPINVCT